MKAQNYFNIINYARYLFTKKCATPIYLILFVTERCNARCKHCFGSFSSRTGSGTEELSLEELGKISRTMGALLYLLPTGGEPFLRDDLPEIIALFYRNNKLRNVGIPTNGSLTEKVTASVSKILSLCEDMHLGVDISIDALHGAHDTIRGFPGLFEKAVETYWQLKELEKKNSNFKVCVEITVSHYNQDNLSEIYDYFIKELHAYNVFVRLVRGNPRDPAAKDVDIEKYEQFTAKLEHDLQNGIFYGHAVYPFSEFITARDIIGRRMTITTVKENSFQIPCYAGTLTGVMRSTGEVYPCELLEHAIGNIRDYNYNFKELWQSERADKIRRQIREDKCYCTHECFITNNILFNPTMLPRVLKEYVKLKLR